MEGGRTGPSYAVGEEKSRGEARGLAKAGSCWQYKCTALRKALLGAPDANSDLAMLRSGNDREEGLVGER